LEFFQSHFAELSCEKDEIQQRDSMNEKGTKKGYILVGGSAHLNVLYDPQLRLTAVYLHTARCS
jgi:hypothetical protein